MTSGLRQSGVENERSIVHEVIRALVVPEDLNRHSNLRRSVPGMSCTASRRMNSKRSVRSRFKCTKTISARLAILSAIVVGCWEGAFVEG